MRARRLGRETNAQLPAWDVRGHVFHGRHSAFASRSPTSGAYSYCRRSSTPTSSAASPSPRSTALTEASTTRLTAVEVGSSTTSQPMISASTKDNTADLRKDGTDRVSRRTCCVVPDSARCRGETSGTMATCDGGQKTTIRRGRCMRSRSTVRRRPRGVVRRTTAGIVATVAVGACGLFPSEPQGGAAPRST